MPFKIITARFTPANYSVTFSEPLENVTKIVLFQWKIDGATTTPSTLILNFGRTFSSAPSFDFITDGINYTKQQYLLFNDTEWYFTDRTSGFSDPDRVIFDATCVNCPMYTRPTMPRLNELTITIQDGTTKLPMGFNNFYCIFYVWTC